MVRVKTSVDKKTVSANQLSRSALDNSSPSPMGIPVGSMSTVAGSHQLYESVSSPKPADTSNAMNAVTKKSPDLPHMSCGTTACGRRSSSVAPPSGRNKVVDAPSISKRHGQSNSQRSRSVSAAIRGKTTSSGTSKRSRSAPVSRKTTGGTRASYKAIVRKIAKAVDPSAKLSPTAVRVLDSFVNDMLRRLAVELGRLCEQTGQRIVSTDDVRFAISLLFTGDLLLHALDEGNRAVARYRLNSQ